MELVIREAKPDDVPALLPLLALVERDQAPAIGVHEGIELLEKIQSYPDAKVYVAESAGQVVGMFELFILPNLAHHGMPSAIIEDVAVRADLQGQGIGKQMMVYAMETCKAAGCYKMALSSGLQRKAAHQFYEGIGFDRYGVCFAVNPIP